ncbi:MAG: alpha/beta hydrolase [Pseudonocardia sp.]|nr:alpha/beta hydrolase [Pseudonocardia sp.]
MPGKDAEFLAELYRSWNRRINANPEMDIDTQRDVFEEWHLPTREPTGVTYDEVTAGGVPAIRCLPVDADTGRVLLFLHGGGGVVGSAHTHRKLAAHIAKATGATALVLDYRLGPESPFPAQVEDAVAAYRGLLEQGYAPNRIATVGDSAGGAFAISTVVSLREQGVQLPAAIVSMSPYTDMELSGDAMVDNAETEALVDRPLMENMVLALLVGQTEVTDPLANLLYADLSGLPPIFITAGELEMLRDDGTRLAELAGEAGVDVTFEIGKEMQHVYQFLAGRAVEGDEAVERIGAWLGPRLGP